MSKTALLVMDIQPGILASLGNNTDEYLGKIQTAITTARGADMPVIFVVVRFREGAPEISPRNKMFERIKSDHGQEFFETAALAQPAIKVEAHDFLVVKRRVSAFSGSDLEVILRALAVDSLVLCGIATSGVVLSTVREAADKDYTLTVLADACFDQSQDVHEILLSKIFPRQATVVTVQEWTKAAPPQKAG
jgi:nicotinamidase-related amidase